MPGGSRGRIVVFIDEIQYLKNPTNFLKYLYDEHGGKIKLIVTGSSAFYLDKKFRDSLAGRKIIFPVNTLSFREFLLFKKEKDLYQKDFNVLGLAEKNKLSAYYYEYLLYGGYPRVVLSELNEKENILRELAYSYIKKDIYEAGVRQDEIFYKLFKILAGQVGCLVNSSELSNTLDISKTAVDNYLLVMQKSFHIFLVKPFHQNIRKEISKMPKIYFNDLGLRNFFTGDFRGLAARNDQGQLLENAVFRQLRERYELEKIKFWRTTDQKEIDFVVGDQEALEVKHNVKNLKIKNWEYFLKIYPSFKLSIISLDAKIDKIESYPVVDAWKI
mgnify:FL=1